MNCPLQTIVELPEYLRKAKQIGLPDSQRMEIVDFLANNPKAGIGLGGGLRKVRIAKSGKGKSAGYRVIHFYKTENFPLFLITIFAKNEKDNLTNKERNDLVSLCKILEKTYRSRK